ncbi:hypothetical protein [Methylomonas sp. HYX-M1]|uniref:hypothetical protein n=1 Tax=Methylomonas sp. HYX-M1 TaxID=3139307 RepID=UPI00345C2BB1
MASLSVDRESESLQVLAEGFKSICKEYALAVQQAESYSLAVELGLSVRFLARCLTLVLCSTLSEQDQDLSELNELSWSPLTEEADEFEE